MPDRKKFLISFPDLNDATAHEHAQSLLSDLKQDHELRPSLDLDRSAVSRTDDEAMDLGATLVLVLAAPAVVVLAKAIKSWAERTNRASIAIDGVRIDNVNSRDVSEIISALRGGASSGTEGVIR